MADLRAGSSSRRPPSEVLVGANTRAAFSETPQNGGVAAPDPWGCLLLFRCHHARVSSPSHDLSNKPLCMLRAACRKVTKDQVRQLTSRRAPVTTQELIDELNAKLRGWGHYYQRAHVRRLFTQLDAWIVRRIWAHRCKSWRCSGWKQLPQTKLYSEMELVSLLALHLRARPPGRESVKAACGKLHVQFERRTGASVIVRLRASSDPTKSEGPVDVFCIELLISRVAPSIFY